jgi:hypothetical protein
MLQLRAPAMLFVFAVAGACARDTPTAPGADLAEAPAISSRSAANCENVRGDIEGNFFAPDGFTLGGLGKVSVAVVGIDAKGAEGQGAIHSVTMHQINTLRGTITTLDKGVLAPIDPPLYRLAHRWTIVGGTGAFHAASGFFSIHANINLATGDIEGPFHGRICE